MVKLIKFFISNEKYRAYLIASLVCHSILLLFLIFNMSFVHTQTIKVSNVSGSQAKPEPKIVKAVAVNSKLVEKEIARLDKIEADKKLQEQQRQKKLKDELAEVKKQKQREAQKLKEAQLKAKKLKQEQEMLKKQQEQIAKQNRQAKDELAKKQAERNKVEQELKEKLAKKREEDLLAKLKAEQQAILDENLEAEDELIESSRKQNALARREIERYIALQQSKVSRNWISRESFLGRDLVTKLEIRLAPDGKVISVNVVQPSGDKALDISAKNAILKSSPLPVPSSETLRKNFTVYRFTFRPDELT